MSLLDQIRTQIEGVLAPGFLVEAWQYRSLTGLPTAQPRVYGSWTAIQCLATERRVVETFDNERQTSARQETQRLRVSQTQPALFPGDQVRDPSGLTWQVLGALSGGPGTLSYQIGRDIGMMAQAADRKGGV